MADANLALKKYTGTDAGTKNSVTKFCYLSADDATETASTYPVSRPQTGDPAVYSYENWLKLELSVAPDNYVQNVKVWGSADQPDSPTNKLTIYFGTTATGVTPTDSQSSTATTNQHTNHYEQGNALLISSGQLTAVGHSTNYLVTQMKVEAGASSGSPDSMIMHFCFEEA